MALLPVQAWFRGDFVVQVVVVDTDDQMPQVAEKVAYHAVGRRIWPRNKPMAVFFRGERVPNERTVAELGVAPMDYLEVGYVD
jgi:toluene monooxygenase system protein B